MCSTFLRLPRPSTSCPSHYCHHPFQGQWATRPSQLLAPQSAPCPPPCPPRRNPTSPTLLQRVPRGPHFWKSPSASRSLTTMVVSTLVKRCYRILTALFSPLLAAVAQLDLAGCPLCPVFRVLPTRTARAPTHQRPCHVLPRCYSPANSPSSKQTSHGPAPASKS